MKLSARQQHRLVEWMRHSHVSAQAPEDWAASGECARLLAQCLLRYGTALDGDLANAQVRSDLRMLRAVVDLALAQGEEQQRAKERKTEEAARRISA